MEGVEKNKTKHWKVKQRGQEKFIAESSSLKGEFGVSENGRRGCGEVEGMDVIRKKEIMEDKMRWDQRKGNQEVIIKIIISQRGGGIKERGMIKRGAKLGREVEGVDGGWGKGNIAR